MLKWGWKLDRMKAKSIWRVSGILLQGRDGEGLSRNRSNKDREKGMSSRNAQGPDVGGSEPGAIGAIHSDVNVGGYERDMGMDGRNLLYLISFGLFCLRHLWAVRLLFKSQL